MKLLQKWRLRLFRWQQSLLYSLLKTRCIGPSQSFDRDTHTIRLYAFLYPSAAEHMVADREAITLGLEAPTESAFSQQQQLSPFFHVYRRSGTPFRKAGKPVISNTLLAAARWQLEHPQDNLEIVPVRIFWGRQPDKEGSFLRIWLQNSGTLGGRLFTLAAIIFNGRNTFVHFSRPLSLQPLIRNTENANTLARKTALILRLHFRTVAATVIGPDLSHRHTLISTIPNRPLVQTAIEHRISEQGISPGRARRKALAYADEIASNISYTTVRFMDVLLEQVWNRLYDGVSIHHIEQLKNVARENTVIYVPCHRSHIDYLLLSYVLYHNGLQLPQIAAGINLNLPIVGPVLRRSGAFFIRRSFRDNKLYAAVFDEYLHTLFTRGYATEYFVEGGRSRNGRTLTPKAGMLAMTLRSYLRDSRKPILFMPVYIGYEKVFEASSYQRELKGHKKQKESLTGILTTLKSFKRNFGKVHLGFGQPLYLSEFLNQEHPGWREENHTDSGFRPEWAPPVVNRLARRIVTGINQAAIINPVNLIALVMLTAPRRVLSETMLLKRMENWSALLRRNQYSSHSMSAEGDARQWLQQAELLGKISRQSHPLGDLLFLNDQQAAALTYYRNNIIHLLAMPSLLACLLVHRQPFDLATLQTLSADIYPTLRNELFLPWTEQEIAGQSRHWLDSLCQSGYLSTRSDLSENDCYCAVDDRQEAFAGLEALARLMMPTLQRYYLVIALIQQNEPLPVAVLEQQSSLLASRISLLHGLDAPEFSDTGLFRNLLEDFCTRGLLISHEDGMIHSGESLRQLAKHLEALLDGEIRHSIRSCCQEMNETLAQTGNSQKHHQQK